MRYLSYKDCEVDIVREIWNRSQKYSVIVLIGGHSQSGKTTLEWYLNNRFCQFDRYGYKALNPFASCNTWREWDWKKYTALNAQDFVRLWNNNMKARLALAEASTQLYYMDWFKVMGKVFNSTTSVLGKQLNICLLDTVMESELLQKARDKLDFRIEVHYRDDKNMRAIIRSGKTYIDYLGMKWMLIRFNEWVVQYSRRMLLQAKKYTDWIAETLKRQEMEENERRVGIRISVQEEEVLRKEREINEWNIRQQKEPVKREDIPF